MANAEHLEILKKGVEVWNEWRRENEGIRPDLKEANLSFTNLRFADLSRAILIECKLSKADLIDADLIDADLSRANLNRAILSHVKLNRAKLSGANLSHAKLSGANLSHAKLFQTNLNRAGLFQANLSHAGLFRANLSHADLSKADLSKADFSRADLSGANLKQANLSGANLGEADLSSTKLFQANLNSANLSRVDLFQANLSHADLSGANLFQANLSMGSLIKANLSRTKLSIATLVKTKIEDATLNGCNIYGTSVWDLRGEPKEQKDLIITPPDQPEVTVDNIKVAQFIYLLLENEEIRDVIDTLTSKSVLILGRFSDERKKVLDAIKDSLRAKGYLPILFDFEKPASRDLTETIKTLASLSKFIITDITDAKSIPQELSEIVKDFPSIPVQPLILESQQEYAMFERFRRYPWVLDVYQYPSQDILLSNLENAVIAPAERKVVELKP